MKVCGFIFSLSLMTPVVALCDDAPPPPPPPQDVWTGKGQAGFVSSQGNSEGKAANAALDTAYLDGPWNHMFHLGGLYTQSAGVTTAERWDVLWQTNYDFTKKLFTFGALRYAHDDFSGFDYQASGTAGIGYKIFDTNTIKLSVQAGAGYREERVEDFMTASNGAVYDRTYQPSDGSAIGTAGVTYSQVLTNTVTLTDKLLLESGSNDTLVTNALALAVKMSTKLSLSLGYGIQNNSSPPAGLKKLDSTETVNLVYAF
jgi:putative salt-induced outer membrane protein